jgi:hypothetical protein
MTTNDKNEYVGKGAEVYLKIPRLVTTARVRPEVGSRELSEIIQLGLVRTCDG